MTIKNWFQIKPKLMFKLRHFKCMVVKTLKIVSAGNTYLLKIKLMNFIIHQNQPHILAYFEIIDGWKRPFLVHKITHFSVLCS